MGETEIECMKCGTETDHFKTIVDGDYCQKCFNEIILDEGIPAWELSSGSYWEPREGYIGLTGAGHRLTYYQPATGLPHSDYFMDEAELRAAGYEVFGVFVGPASRKADGVCRRMLRQMEDGFAVGISLDEARAFKDRDVTVKMWRKPTLELYA